MADICMENRRKVAVVTGAPQDDPPKQGADFNWQCWTHDPDGIKIELMQISEDSPNATLYKGDRTMLTERDNLLEGFENAVF